MPLTSTRSSSHLSQSENALAQTESKTITRAQAPWLATATDRIPRAMSLRRCSRAIYACAAVFLAFSGHALHADGRIDPLNPPQGRFSDEWFEIHMGPGKVGYGHNALTRDGDVVESRSTYVMRMGRVDQPIRISISQFTRETVAGVPLAFGSEMDASVMKTATRGTVKDDQVRIVTSQYGMEQTQTYPFPKGALMSWGLFRESLIRGFEPGLQYSLKTYAPELRLDDAVSAETRVGDWEPIKHHGQDRRGRRVEVTMTSPLGEMTLVSWVDENGKVLQARMPAPGIGDMTMIAVDQATAMKDFVPPEMFMTTALKASREIDVAKAQQIRYRLRPRNPGTPPDPELGKLPTTDMQSVTALPDGAVEVKVTRQSHARTGSPEEGTPATPPSAAMAEFLEANLMINTADPELIALTRRALGDEKDPFAQADRLRRFVTDYVEIKSLNIGFATASEVARTREGDCSEHAVLLAALGRIADIPTRVVAGLAYVPIFGGQDDIFGYHMWTQFYLDGRWIDLDAALRETDSSPARITLAVSSLRQAGMADLSMPLISRIGAIDLDILEVTPRSTQETP